MYSPVSQKSQARKAPFLLLNYRLVSFRKTDINLLDIEPIRFFKYIIWSESLLEGLLLWRLERMTNS